MARNTTVGFDDAMQVVDELATEIRGHRHGILVDEVLKAGSLGQHTAVPGNFDVDLVIYAHNVDKDYVLNEGYEMPIHKLRSFLGGLRRVQLQPPLKTSVLLKYSKSNIELDVDILVSPVWKDRKELYDYLLTAKRNGATPQQLFRFSVNASKWQVEFIKKQDDKAKELIHKAKAWRNREWPEGTRCVGRPKSYLYPGYKSI